MSKPWWGREIIDDDEEERLMSIFRDRDRWDAMSDDERRDWETRLAANTDEYEMRKREIEALEQSIEVDTRKS